MQFGRIQGIALAVLGLILIAIQVMVSMAPRKNVAAPAQAATKTVESKSSLLPGIVGAISLIGGLAIFATAGRSDEPPPENAVK